MVSSPSQTRLTFSSARRSALIVKVYQYSQSFSATHSTLSSLSATNGSGILFSASKSVCTPPGTIAGDHSFVPHWRNCHSPFKDCFCIILSSWFPVYRFTDESTKQQHIRCILLWQPVTSHMSSSVAFRLAAGQ